MFQKVTTVLGDFFLILLTIFLAFDNRFISFVRSNLPTFAISDAVFHPVRHQF